MIQHAPTTVLAPRGSIEAAFERFLTIHVAGGAARHATREAYLKHAQAWIDHCRDARITPETATPEHVAAYRAELLARYAPATVGLKLNAVRRLYAALQAAGLRADNPAAHVSAPKRRTAAHTELAGRYVDLAVIQGLFRADPSAHHAASQCAARDAAMIALMALHGLRVGEVAALRPGDLAGDTLRFSGKGGKIREVYLIPETQALVDAWLAARPAVPAAELFISLDNRTLGHPLTTRSIRRTVKARLAREGVSKPGVSAHSLRHSFATHAYARGARLEEIRDVLGHSSVRTTEHYAKIIDARRTNAARVMSGLTVAL